MERGDYETAKRIRERIEIFEPFIPIVGAAASIVSGVENLFEGNYKGALLDAAALGSQVLPLPKLVTHPKVVNFAGKGSSKAGGVIQGLSIPKLVTKAATAAEKCIGGVGRFAGMKKHKYAKELLERYQKIYKKTSLDFNKYFKNRGGKGFLDVYDTVGDVIYDFKFGKAFMSKKQYNKYIIQASKVKVIRPKQ